MARVAARRLSAPVVGVRGFISEAGCSRQLLLSRSSSAAVVNLSHSVVVIDFTIVWLAYVHRITLEPFMGQHFGAQSIPPHLLKPKSIHIRGFRENFPHFHPFPIKACLGTEMM